MQVVSISKYWVFTLDLQKKYVWLSGSADFFNPLEATAYICNKCGYIELFAT